MSIAVGTGKICIDRTRLASTTFFCMLANTTLFMLAMQHNIVHAGQHNALHVDQHNVVHACQVTIKPVLAW